ncbi:MAG: PAS domain S-box protein [Azospirillum sp.]|nr:PAS domain S-box protein [Azospirillum sp.]
MSRGISRLGRALPTASTLVAVGALAATLVLWHWEAAAAPNERAKLVVVVGFTAALGLWLGIQALERRLQRYREMVEAASDWFWEADVAWRFTHVSDRFFTLTGLAPAAVLGRALLEPSVARCQDVCAPFRDLQFSIPDCEGRLRQFSLSGRPIFCRNGILRGYRGIGTEVTEYRLAEAATVEKAAQLEVAIEVMPNAVVMFDHDLEVKVYNQNFLALWNLSEADLQTYHRLPALIRFLAERGDYGDGDVERQVARRLGQIVQERAVTYRIRRADGRLLEVQGYGRSTIGYVLTYLDVTERDRADAALRDSERRLQQILDYSPVGISIAGQQPLRRLYHNKRLAELYGGGAQGDLLNEPILDSYVDPADLQDIFAELNTTGKVSGRIVARRRKDGSLWWCLFDAVAIDYEGGPAYIVWHYDITDRRLMEEELRQSRQFLHAVIDSIPALVNVKDRALRHVLMNRYEAALAGIEPEAAVGRTTVELLGDEPWTQRLEEDRKVLVTGEVEHFHEVSLEFPLGGRRDWLITKLPIRDSEEAVANVLTLGLDITPRKRAEDAMRQSEERLKLALAVTRSGVWDLDLGSRRRSWSPQLPELVGYEDEDFRCHADPFAFLIHPDDRAEVQRLAIAHLHGETSEFRAEYRMRHKGGWWLWFEDIGRVVFDAEGGAGRFIGIIVDITERRATRMELVRSEGMAALGRLVAGIAHEINTPVGLGVGVASHHEDRTRAIKRLYDAGEITMEDFEDYLQTSLESAAALLSNLRRAADLVRSFKQVAVDQSSELKRRFEVRDYIEELLRSLKPKLKNTSHSISVDCPGGLTIESFPGALSQILTNLIENSLIHGFEGRQFGHISISVLKTARRMILLYADDGKGMAEAECLRIFEPFFTTRMGQGGSGLGMHIVYNLVTQTLGGRITCTSLPDLGISVTIRIPLELERAGHERHA